MNSDPTPRTNAAIKEATDYKNPDLLHYMSMTGVLNQLCRLLEIELNEMTAKQERTMNYWQQERERCSILQRELDACRAVTSLCCNRETKT